MWKINIVKKFEEVRGLFKDAYLLSDNNSKNYYPDAMLKRWPRYEIFTTLHYNDDIVGMSGVYDYGKNLVRVADRMFTFPKYRHLGFVKNIYEGALPGVKHFIPYHTQWAFDNDKIPFFSIQTIKKRNGMKRVVRMLDNSLDYKLLPGLYCTCDPSKENCWQNVAVSGDIDMKKYLPYKEI
jgi:hypothetical protein